MLNIFRLFCNHLFLKHSNNSRRTRDYRRVRNTITIGDGAGQNLVRGSHNIFLGDNAGAELEEADHLCIIRTHGVLVSGSITTDQWESFNNMLLQLMHNGNDEDEIVFDEV